MQKLNSNRLRDIDNQEQLRNLGWDVMIVWECELRNLAAVQGRVREFLGP